MMHVRTPGPYQRNPRIDPVQDTGPGPTQRPTLAYLTTAYPSVTHTFIRREILGLEKLGYRVLRLAIRPGESLVDSADLLENERSLHLLGQAKTSLVLQIVRGMRAARGRILRGMVAMWRLSRTSERGFVRHLAYLAEALALIDVCNSREVEHVHVHFGTNAAAVAMLARKMGGATFSMTIHGPDEFDAPIGLSLGWKVTESLFTVAVSSYCASQLRRWVPHTEWNKIEIVHCTIGDEWFEPCTPVREDAIDFVCVARLSAQKGQLLLLDAMAKAIDLGLEGNLVLIGDGELRGAIESRVTELQLTNRVDIVGWCDGEQIRRHLLQSRALVLPSFAEGLPVVIMEAMALQRPVLTTCIMGIPELVVDGETGWLIPPADEDALVEALLQAAGRSLGELRDMGRAARERVRTRHLCDSEMPKLDRIFLSRLRESTYWGESASGAE